MGQAVLAQAVLLQTSSSPRSCSCPMGAGASAKVIVDVKQVLDDTSDDALKVACDSLSLQARQKLYKALDVSAGMASSGDCLELTVHGAVSGEFKCNVQLPHGSTVLAAKEAIHLELRLPIVLQSLLFEGRVLPDAAIVADLFQSDDSKTITLIESASIDLPLDASAWKVGYGVVFPSSDVIDSIYIAPNDVWHSGSECRNYIESKVEFRCPLRVSAEIQTDSAECASFILFQREGHMKNDGYSLEIGAWSDSYRLAMDHCQFDERFGGCPDPSRGFRKYEIELLENGSMTGTDDGRVVGSLKVGATSVKEGTVMFIPGMTGMHVRNVSVLPL